MFACAIDGICEEIRHRHSSLVDDFFDVVLIEVFGELTMSFENGFPIEWKTRRSADVGFGVGGSALSQDDVVVDPVRYSESRNEQGVARTTELHRDVDILRVDNHLKTFDCQEWALLRTRWRVRLTYLSSTGPKPVKISWLWRQHHPIAYDPPWDTAH